MSEGNSNKLNMYFAGEEFPSLHKALFPLWHENKLRSTPT